MPPYISFVILPIIPHFDFYNSKDPSVITGGHRPRSCIVRSSLKGQDPLATKASG